MVIEEESTKIVNFTTPGVGILVLRCGHISSIVKIHYFFKNSRLPSTDQSNWGYSNDVWGRVYQNYKFHEPEGRDSCAGAWSYSERATLLLFILSILGHESDKLSIKQWEQGKVFQDCNFHYYRGWGSYARTCLFKSLQWICIIFYSINLHHIDCYFIQGI